MHFRKLLALFSVIVVLSVTSQNCGKVAMDELASSEPEPTFVDGPSNPESLSLPTNTKVIEYDVNQHPNGFQFSIGSQEELSQIKDIQMDSNGGLSTTTSYNNELSFNPNLMAFAFKPKQGFLGFDQKEILLTGSDGTVVTFKIIFIVRSLSQIQETNALIYGPGDEDQIALEKKINGEKPSGMGDIFTKWERTTDNLIYSPSDLVGAIQTEKSGSDAFCFGENVEGDPLTGKYKAILLPKITNSTTCTLEVDNAGNYVLATKASDPGGHCTCAKNKAFQAQSWGLIADPARILSLVNSARLTGFVSPLKFENYTHSSVMQSTNNDDDLVALIIAHKSEVDSTGTPHNYTLAAIREHGGVGVTGRATTLPALNWAIVYFEDGIAKKIISEKTVGISYKNPATGAKSVTLQNDGWSGKSTLVKVTRNKDVIEAWTSDWALSGETFSDIVDPESRLTVNLNDENFPQLEKFIGPQKFGYGSLSQMWSSFNNVKFDAGSVDKYVFDLKKNEVFELQNDGKYSKRFDINPYLLLGVPRIVGNPETFKRYRLKEDQSYLLCRDEACLD